MNKTPCAIIVTGGGASTRYGNGNKLLELIDGVPVFIHSIRNLAGFADKENFILTVPAAEFDHFTDIGKLAACSRARVLYLLGDFAELIKEGALSCGFDERNIFTNHDLSNPTPTAIQILKSANDGEILLLKGSHSTRLHRVVDILKKLTEARDVR